LKAGALAHRLHVDKLPALLLELLVCLTGINLLAAAHEGGRYDISPHAVSSRVHHNMTNKIRYPVKKPDYVYMTQSIWIIDKGLWQVDFS
jgi:hypothetical protein